VGVSGSSSYLGVGGAVHYFRCKEGLTGADGAGNRWDLPRLRKWLEDASELVVAPTIRPL
jgi:hypothetical protein